MPARFDASNCPVPRWLPEGHSQTIVGARWASYLRVSFARERVDTPDGDFIDFDWATPGKRALDEIAADPAPIRALASSTAWKAAARAPTLSPSPITFAPAAGWSWCRTFAAARARPTACPAPTIPGTATTSPSCWTPCARACPPRRWHAAGVSLGGNALAKFLGERGDEADWLAACAAVSAPLDLTAGGHTLGRGAVNRHIYTRMFLRTLRDKVLDKARRFPAIIDVMRVAEARDLHEFDDAYTAPLHGFANVADYWSRASALPWLRGIAVPTLVLNARNDPFLPASVLPGVAQASDKVLLHQPAEGGHAVFPGGGRLRPHLNWLPRRLERFFEAPSA